MNYTEDRDQAAGELRNADVAVISVSRQFRHAGVPKAARTTPAAAIVDLHSHGGMYLFGNEKVIDLGEGRNHAAMGPYRLEN